MFRRLFRWLFLLITVAVLFWLLAPRLFDSAANSLISSVSSSAQGQAQYIPGGVNSPTKGELQINMTGLNNNAVYQLKLDQGRCDGGSSTGLGQSKSDSSGNLYFDLLLASINTHKTWYINVLQDGLSVACGHLQTNLNTGTQVIDASESGPNVFGPHGTPSTSQQSNGTTPTANNNSNSGQPVKALPNTGSGPGDNQQYDNHQYPRKY